MGGYIMNLKKERTFKLLESKKFNIAITAINVTLIVILIGTIVFMYISNSKKTQNSSPDGAQKIDEVTVDQLMNDADESMLNVYKVLIQGTIFEPADGVKFNFGSDGTFSGYFDSENSNVDSYSYEVAVNESNIICLNIYSPDKNKSVQYEMSFDSNGNIVLTNPGMDPFILEY